MTQVESTVRPLLVELPIIVTGDRIASTARQSGYFASLETLRPIRIPEPLRSRWEAELRTSKM